MPTVTEKKQLNVFVLSWNMANSVVAGKDILTLTEKMQKADLIIVEAQEETRQDMHTLVKKLQKQLAECNHHFKLAARAAYDVHTSVWESGQVSSSVLVRGGVDCEVQVRGIYHERDDGALVSNKGGITSNLTVVSEGIKYQLNVIGAHLASKNDAKKINEMTQLFKFLEGDGSVTYEQLRQFSSDLDIVSGDLNYRNIYKGENASICPFAEEDLNNPVSHFSLRGFKFPEFNPSDDFTYGGKGAGNFCEKYVKRKDFRLVGASGDYYCKGGMLDIVMHRGAAAFNKGFEIVTSVESAWVDHRPIVANFSISPSESDFVRTKKWVAALLSVVRSNTCCVAGSVISSIALAQENAESKAFLTKAYNYFMKLVQLQDLGEYFRARQDTALSVVINGEKGLVHELLQTGNRFFQKELTATDFLKEVTEAIQRTLVKSPRLQAIESVWLWLKDIILRVITLGCRRVKSPAQEKIESFSRCCQGLFSQSARSSLREAGVSPQLGAIT